MKKKNIAVISLDADDFQLYFRSHVGESESSTRKKHVTIFTTYHCITKVTDLCSLTLDGVHFTENAIFNKNLTQIIEVVRPCIISPEYKN